MKILARAIRVDNGQTIEGLYCQHEFVKLASELTEEEKAEATPVPLPPLVETSDSSSSDDREPTHYVALRDCIQVTGEKQVTVNKQTFKAKVADFIEIVKGSVRAYSGFTDKNDVKIFEGDKISYQSGIKSNEIYTVIFNNGSFTVSPAWLWGCNFSPFDSRRCEVINQKRL